MSHLLWKYYWENDVDKFRRLLDPSGYASQLASKSPAIGSSALHLAGSPTAVATSPRIGNKPRKSSGYNTTPAKFRDAGNGVGRAEVNGRDHAGLTVLLRAASSTDRNARDFVAALLDHFFIDIYVQDLESGWNALHRALYHGNISIARMLLEKERRDLADHTLSSVRKIGLLIKTKDHEGHSPFDLYNSTIAMRTSKLTSNPSGSDADSDGEDSPAELRGNNPEWLSFEQLGLFRDDAQGITGDELFVFGSNKNLSLGVGDEDDRQYPERLIVARPDKLLHRFHQSYLASNNLGLSVSLPSLEEIPNLIRSTPFRIQDVVMSKFHSAILTTDPVSNLYTCGVGRGGRLGLGDENTQFRFRPVQGPLADKKIRHVALGQNHSMAVADNGELWTWGLNSDSQLGYVLPPTLYADEEPISVVARQVFGPLRKEFIQGVAASSVHSVAYSGQSLYCWGRNLGQLALMDADSRSLDTQQIPRKVAASLLSAPIGMVSAIEKATTCLLTNGTVLVFANYGYNLIKFPPPDVYTNSNINVRFSFPERHDPFRRKIRQITSGGETIAAVTLGGDLFTMHLRDTDSRQVGGSTTNPAKIRDAITKPQCIWDSKKDGVTTVGVSEHGSVIICTESGAVWRRVKRTKGKIATYTATADSKPKDFKFERVPYITNCVSVRSSVFGAFAALRTNNGIMAKGISVDKQSVWEDVACLLCLKDFRASETRHDSKAPKNAQKSRNGSIEGEKPGSVSHEILRSPDIESDLLRWLKASSTQYETTDMEIRAASLPDVRIPVHGWVLSGRSAVLRKAIDDFRRRGASPSSDGFALETFEGELVMTLLDVDVFTLLNVLVYCYQDAMVPVWKYTQKATHLAYRFRQVRTEVMKVATQLQMPKLEAAARVQTELELSMDSDLRKAIADPLFFQDGDILVQLDGANVTVHSQLMCQRCPFFEGMFHGRSGGQWLSNRRNNSRPTEKVSIDLEHISPKTFHYILAFIYADVGAEMFDDVALPTIDDFSELVLDVMSAANELMLDRLSQICQSVIGRFVTTRNISALLNEISPCAVTKFKDTGLEYICLQLESMLENHLLDNLDDDLMQDLDGVVRDNQLAQLPFVRSGRAELLLHQNHPDLALDINEERQRRLKAMSSKITLHDARKLSSSYKTRFGSLEDDSTRNQTPESARSKSSARRNEPFSPYLHPRRSHGDLVFDMDEEDSSAPGSPLLPTLDSMRLRPDSGANPSAQALQATRESKSRESREPGTTPISSPALPTSPRLLASPPATIDSAALRAERQNMSVPWASTPFPTAKLDLKDIMSETSPKSALTASLAAQSPKDTGASKTQIRVSQKERKKQMQLEADALVNRQKEVSSGTTAQKVAQDSRPAPWLATTSSPKPSLDDAMASQAAARSSVQASVKPLVASESRPQSIPRRTASPDTRFPGQARTASSPAVRGEASRRQEKPVVPHSKSYIKRTPKEESNWGGSMADIIGQQRREQEVVKEAVAKRSLQEIQEEQAFQEWWDLESRRAQGEDDEAGKPAKSKEKDTRDGRRRARGRGGKAKPEEAVTGGHDGGRATSGGARGVGDGRGGSRRRGDKGDRSSKGKGVQA